MTFTPTSRQQPHTYLTEHLELLHQLVLPAFGRQTALTALHYHMRLWHVHRLFNEVRQKRQTGMARAGCMLANHKQRQQRTCWPSKSRGFTSDSMRLGNLLASYLINPWQQTFKLWHNEPQNRAQPTPVPPNPQQVLFCAGWWTSSYHAFDLHFIHQHRDR